MAVNEQESYRVQVCYPMPLATIHVLGEQLIAELALCANCYYAMECGGSANVGFDDPTLARMVVYATTEREMRTRSSGKRPSKTESRSEPQNVKTCRKVGGHEVWIYADPRLTDRAVAEWGRRLAAGEVTPAMFRRIVAALEAGPDAKPGKRPNLSASDPAKGKPPLEQDAPLKRNTKVRLKWSPRTGFYDADAGVPKPPTRRTRAALARTAGM